MEIEELEERIEELFSEISELSDRLDDIDELNDRLDDIEYETSRIDDFEYDRDYQADKLEEIWTVLATSGIATVRGKVKCYCGETMVEEEFRNGKWQAIQFCSQECKDKGVPE